MLPGCLSQGALFTLPPSLPPSAAGTSPYMPITLMRSQRDFFKFYTFEDAAAEELETWKDAFLAFLRKVGQQRQCQRQCQCQASGRPASSWVQQPSRTGGMSRLVTQAWHPRRVMHANACPFQQRLRLRRHAPPSKNKCRHWPAQAIVLHDPLLCAAVPLAPVGSTASLQGLLC